MVWQLRKIIRMLFILTCGIVTEAYLEEQAQKLCDVAEYFGNTWI